MHIKTKNPFTGAVVESDIPDKGGIVFFADWAKFRAAILTIVPGEKPVMWKGSFDKGVRMVAKVGEYA